jgi:hypothetical protein
MRSEGQQLTLFDSAPSLNRLAATLEGLRAEGVCVGEALKRAREELAVRRFTANPEELRTRELHVKSLEADLAGLNREAADLIERNA